MEVHRAGFPSDGQGVSGRIFDSHRHGSRQGPSQTQSGFACTGRTGQEKGGVVGVCGQFINVESIPPASGSYFNMVNPSAGEVIAEVPRGGKEIGIAR